MRAKVPYHEYGYELLRRAEAYEPHTPVPMLSGESTGPLKFWVCGFASCRATARTLDLTPPVCSGGLPFSFTTKDAK